MVTKRLSDDKWDDDDPSFRLTDDCDFAEVNEMLNAHSSLEYYVSRQQTVVKLFNFKKCREKKV